MFDPVPTLVDTVYVSTMLVAGTLTRFLSSPALYDLIASDQRAWSRPAIPCLLFVKSFVTVTVKGAASRSIGEAIAPRAERARREAAANFIFDVRDIEIPARPYIESDVVFLY